MTPSKDQFFRGGQAHGTLSNAGAPRAVARLLQQEVPVLARLIAKASSDKEDNKNDIAKDLGTRPISRQGDGWSRLLSEALR